MEEKKIDANKIVSPKTTKKLYGEKNLDGEEPRPGDMETVETSLPQNFEGVDQDVENTMFPSKPSPDTQQPSDH